MQAVPFNREATEWADCNHFDGGRLACLKYAFNPKSGLYEWTAIGPLLEAGKGVSEASLARWKDEWIIAARGGPGGVTWFRTGDPFAATASRLIRTGPRLTCR